MNIVSIMVRLVEQNLHQLMVGVFEGFVLTCISFLLIVLLLGFEAGIRIQLDIAAHFDKLNEL